MDCEDVGECMDCSDLKRIMSFCEAVNEETQVLIRKRLISGAVNTLSNTIATFHLLCPEDSKDLSKEALVL